MTQEISISWQLYMSITKVSIMFNLHSPARLSTPTTDKAPHLMEVPSNSFNVDTPIGRSCMNVLRYAQNCTDLQSLPISGEVRVWINNCVCTYVCVCVCVYMCMCTCACIYVYMCIHVYYVHTGMYTCLHACTCVFYFQHVAAISHCSKTLLQVPLLLPKYFFNRHQQTSIKVRF